MSHAPGFSGTPDSGHFSSAVTSASCASSSASPTSRTRRASAATSRAHSIRNTASMARWVARCGDGADTAEDQTTAPADVQGVPVASLGGVGEVGGLEDLPDLHLALVVVRVGTALEPLDGLLARADLPDPVAGH